MGRTQTIGDSGELLFAYHAVENGFTVLFPFGIKGYDCVVEMDNKFTKVQIKTTSVIDQKRRYSWSLNDKGTIADVYVLHVMGTNIFFMIDANIVNKKKSNYKISLKNINSEFLNNWEIFK